MSADQLVFVNVRHVNRLIITHPPTSCDVQVAWNITLTRSPKPDSIILPSNGFDTCRSALGEMHMVCLGQLYSILLYSVVCREMCHPLNASRFLC